MFDINTQLRRAFVSAHKQAQRSHHNYVDGLTLTLGILDENSSRAAQVLGTCNLSLQTLRQAAAGPGDSETLYEFAMPEVTAQMTQSLADAIAMAGEAANQAGLHVVTCEAVLLTLLQQGNGRLMRALIQAGLGPEQKEFVESELSQFLSGGRPTFSSDSSADDEPAPEPVPSPPAAKSSWWRTKTLPPGAPKDQSAKSAGKFGTGSSGAFVNHGGRPDRPNKKTSVLEQFGIDLTDLARTNKLPPVIGRINEIGQALKILGRKTKNNPILVGEAGVGKTAVVEGIAQRIAKGDVPKRLQGKHVFQIDLNGMVAGSRLRGDFEERLAGLIQEVKKRKDVILFFDELHTLLGAGGSGGGSLDAANALKPALARGELSTIGATTLDEYRKYVEKDKALSRRFRVVTVEPPTSAETIQILHGLRRSYEDHHGVRISDEAIVQAVELADRYISDRFQPDKAIDLVDEAASGLIMEEEAKERQKAAKASPLAEGVGGKVAGEIGSGSGNANATATDTAATTEPASIASADAAAGVGEKAAAGGSKRAELLVTGEHVAQVISMATGIPLARLTSDESELLLHLEEHIHRRVIGQKQAVSAVARAIRRGRVGLKDPNRPLGVFLFLGPTGVGKTEVVRALQQFRCGKEDGLIRFDMSEYMEKHSVARLIGAPPGYVGFDQGGLLTEAVRRRPYSVVLFDEIEKAHHDVFNIMLQIYEDGRLTDGQGRTVDFRNTILIMTSNIAAGLIKNSTGGGAELDSDTMEGVMEEVHALFSPEFINRLDDIICFLRLTEDQVGEIAGLMVEKVRQRLTPRRITLTLESSAQKFLLAKGFDEKFGARPMRRAIQRYVEDSLTDGILSGEIQGGDTVSMGWEGEGHDKLVVVSAGERAESGQPDSQPTQGLSITRTSPEKE